jgi:tetratricopeptide (TPR) repeat protein
MNEPVNSTYKSPGLVKVFKLIEESKYNDAYIEIVPIHNEYKGTIAQAMVDYVLAGILVSLRDFDRAEEFLLSSLDWQESGSEVATRNPDLTVDILKTLVPLFTRKGDYDKAEDFLDKWKELRGSDLEYHITASLVSDRKRQFELSETSVANSVFEDIELDVLSIKTLKTSQE